MDFAFFLRCLSVIEFARLSFTQLPHICELANFFIRFVFFISFGCHFGKLTLDKYDKKKKFLEFLLFRYNEKLCKDKQRFRIC